MSSRRAPKAFTILELTIAIAIAAALAALTLPPLLRWVRDARFREACVRLEAGLEECRAESARRGCAVAASSRTHAGRACELVSSVVEERASGAGDGSEFASVLQGVVGKDLEGSGMLSGRVRAVLEAGVVVVTRPGTGVGSVDDSDEITPPEELMLAVFFPDGSAIGEGGVTIEDGHGRSAEVRIDSFSGAARVVEISAAGRGGSRRGGRGTGESSMPGEKSR